MIVSTYQSVSGAGQKGMHELQAQTAAHVAGNVCPAPSKFAHPIAFNCIPQIDDFLPNGYTKEEMKMVHETRKIMGDDSIDVCPTCVRVPVLYSHSESILVETERPITPEAAREVWANAPGLVVVDDPAARIYPLPAAGREPRRGLRRPDPPGPAAGPTPCSSGASATTSAKGPRPTRPDRRGAAQARPGGGPEQADAYGSRRDHLHALPCGTSSSLLSYDGTDFSGWQRQPDRRTVQQVLEEAIGRLTGVEPSTNASGRTDAGVHALGQVVHFYTASRHSPEVFVKALTRRSRPTSGSRGPGRCPRRSTPRSTPRPSSTAT